MASQPDYTTWTHTALIQRLTHLESQLRTPNAQTSPSPAHNHLDAPPKKKTPKNPKPFDPSKYHTRAIALKFAYLGGNYGGFEHHSNNPTRLPTIEEELWRALRKTKLIFPRQRPGQGEEDVCWDGVEYSKCGRTDRGVSAFGQVVGLRVRSARRKRFDADAGSGGVGAADESMLAEGEGMEEKSVEKPFDPIRDELPYIQLINRVLPPDIRILAWCPDPPEGFSARFNCKERRYRYFFTNPAYVTLPGSKAKDGNGKPGEGWLDVEAMHTAAKKYEGLHDFRNFCKVDPSKQISNFERRIFHAGIHEVQSTQTGVSDSLTPKLYYFEVRGSAFLWHQVRHLIGILFLVGQGYEAPSLIDDLLDIQKTSARPVYDMASDIPLVLWECIFPSAENLANVDHADAVSAHSGYTDDLHWIYIGADVGGRDQSKRSTTGVEDGKFGRNGIMDELWALWRKRKMDEVLAQSLMDVVSNQSLQPFIAQPVSSDCAEKSVRLYDGGPIPRTVGTYVPLAQRERMEPPDVVNARYAARKGIVSKSAADADMDE